MTENLAEALKPVSAHFRATEITPNTVLAAHIRALGGKPVGAPWTAAKAALKRGMSFADAAAEGVNASPPSDSAPSKHTSLAAAPFDESDRSASTSRMDETRDQSAAMVEEIEDSFETTVLEDRASDSARGTKVGDPLDWFPKVFGPGDIDGEGAKRLLGTPNIPTVSVLVRETAQNSWDARIGHVPVVFRLHLRLASADERRVLREHVFTGNRDGLTLGSSLAKKDLWLLEVTDRGTNGLGGPVRNDLEPPAGASTNFIDLIFNVGAPRDVHLGGGTYGFGKTIAYRASRPGTVLFWTRTHDQDDRLEDRLIGSAIGSSFTAGGLRHTGRHWWGRRVDDRVEPILGDDARALGKSLFHTGFTDLQTGTSLLIVDPDLGGETPEEDARRLAHACMWHLWPKMILGQGRRVPMGIEVWFNGSPVEIPDPHLHPLLCGSVDALSAVRSVQQGVAFTPTYNTIVQEVWCERPRKLLGHLALTRFPTGRPLDRSDELAPVRDPSSHVTLMRHDAELVVKYDQFQPLDHPNFQWAGVFKPVAAVDDSFALSEPPAHDDWIPTSMENKAQKRDVNVALKRIKEQVSEFLRPHAAGDDNAQRVTPVAAVADALAGLVGGLHGNAPGQRPSRPRGAPVSRRPSVRVTESLLGDLVGERRRGYARVITAGKGIDEVTVRASVAVGVDGGSDPDTELVSVLGWTQDPVEGLQKDGPERPFGAGEESWLVFEFDPGMAVDVSVRIVEDGE